MNLRPLLGTVALGLICQTNRAQADEIILTQGTSGTWNAEWNGAAERTDFLQWSLDLVDWYYMPVVEHGSGVHSYGFWSSSGKLFLRLESTDHPTTDPDNDDFDGDGISNSDEVSIYNTDPLKSDTDCDGLSDGNEILNIGTNPRVADGDGDGLSDGEEIITYGSDPFELDTDGDELPDGDEVAIYGTNPTLLDTDGDWMADDWELDNGLNPLDASDGLLDADMDGLANKIEYVFMDMGYDPFVANSSIGFPWSEDPDSDGLTTAQEFNTHGTNPRQPDTDDDGLGDGWEILYGYSALINNNKDANPANDSTADPDLDGLDNADEDQNETDPNNADSDGDGESDYAEAEGGSNPNNTASTPGNPGGTPGGPAKPPPPIVSVQVHFGDHSGSHSEKYKVWLEPLEGRKYPKALSQQLWIW